MQEHFLEGEEKQIDLKEEEALLGGARDEVRLVFTRVTNGAFESAGC